MQQNLKPNTCNLNETGEATSYLQPNKHTALSFVAVVTLASDVLSTIFRKHFHSSDINVAADPRLSFSKRLMFERRNYKQEMPEVNANS
jgi:hypothetical protein